MKRIIEFKSDDGKYVFFENQRNIFEIRSADLQVDVKKFYSAFFEGDMEYSDIELSNSASDDKVGVRVFECIKQLINEVSTRLLEDSRKPECEDAEMNS